MKRSVPILLSSILLISSFTYQAEAKIYNESDLLKIYKEQGYEYSILEIEQDIKDLQLDQKEKSVKTAKSSMESAKRSYSQSKNSSDTKKVNDLEKRYYESTVQYYQAAKDYAIHDKSLELDETYKEASEKKLEVDFLNKYYDALIMNNNVNLLDEQLKLMQKKHDVLEKKLDLSLISTMDFNQSRLKVAELDIQYNASSYNLSLTKEQLTYSLDIDQELELTYIFEPLKTLNITKDVYLHKVHKDSRKNKELLFEIEANEEMLEKIASVLPEDHKDVVHLSNELERLRFEKKEFDIDNQLKAISNYYNYEKAMDNHTTTQKQFDLSEDQYMNMQTMYTNGQISEIDLLGAQLEKNRVKVLYENAYLELIKEKNKLELSMLGMY